MARKFSNVKYSVADAISYAYGELSSLAEEARDIYDNASEGLQQTQRIQTFEETADTLENLDEPSVPDGFEGEVSFGEEAPRRKNRGLSRSSRCGNAISAMGALVSLCEERIAELDEKEDLSDDEETLKTDLEELRDQLENDKSEAEGCEFPGMYG